MLEYDKVDTYKGKVGDLETQSLKVLGQCRGVGIQ